MKREQILDQLDACAVDHMFPMLDNGYTYHVDQRLHVMRSDVEWLVIIEALGYHHRAGGIDGVQDCLFLFGDNLHREPGMANEDFLNPFEYPQEGVFDPEYEWEVSPTLDHLMVRGQRVPVDLSPDALAAAGIELIDPPQLDPPALLRSLVPQHRDLLLATPTELAARNPHAVPTLIVLDEWNHPDVCDGTRPSESEAFQMLASAIVTGHVEEYRPTMAPNTHWSNWPDGGAL